MSPGADPAAIVGVADYVPAKGQVVPDYMELQIDVARAALKDAGMPKTRIDGLVYSRSGYPMDKEVFPTTFCEYLEIRPAWMETTPHGGAQMGSMLWRAAHGISSGLASAVLIVAADNRESRFSRAGVVSRIAEQNVDTEFEFPYGPIFPTNFALLAQRHMHEYGTTSEQFASVAVAQRRWAQMHPQARMRSPLTVNDVLVSPMISSPLHLLDICLVTDGGGAAVMVARNEARDWARPPVFLLGYGDCGDSQNVSRLTSLTEPGMYRRAADQAFSMARVKRTDVDIAYPYDATTSFAIWGLEQLGLCAPGEAGAFVESGNTAPGGRLPCNTHGGILSYAHPGIAGAFLSIIEACRQLRGEAADRQVPGAEIAVTSTMGGFLTTGVNVLGAEATS